MKRVEFAPAARAELDAAAARYERDHDGRGLRLFAAVERTVAAAATRPLAAALYPGIPAALQVRRRIVHGFPFVIAYRDLGDGVRIDAVVHTRRHPGYWFKRIGV